MALQGGSHEILDVWRGREALRDSSSFKRTRFLVIGWHLACEPVSLEQAVDHTNCVRCHWGKPDSTETVCKVGKKEGAVRSRCLA